MPAATLPGLDYLATAVLLLDENLRVAYANPAAENLFALSRRNLLDHDLPQALLDATRLMDAIHQARQHHATVIEHDLTVQVQQSTLHLSCSVTPVDLNFVGVLIEFQQMDQQIKIAREERLLDQSEANRALIRNLAHEIRNPLGGIRGAAQLLDGELREASLREYTQVIMKEADRLQSLMDRLLTPHRLPRLTEVNIHEVLERVRSLVLAEVHTGGADALTLVRDYDVSLPLLTGDREQLIQVVLNIVRNAVQALAEQHIGGTGKIILRTRALRQVTLAKKRHRLAMALQIIDNGPGVPDSLRDKIFFPLVSGRDNGHGLGLTLAQTFVHQHHGTIECESQPGNTCFTILLPLSTHPLENGARP